MVISKIGVTYFIIKYVAPQIWMCINTVWHVSLSALVGTLVPQTLKNSKVFPLGDITTKVEIGSNGNYVINPDFCLA